MKVRARLRLMLKMKVRVRLIEGDVEGDAEIKGVSYFSLAALRSTQTNYT